LSLDALTKRLSLVGGNVVAKKANALSVAGNQERTAQKYYAQITGLTAEGLFLFLMLALVSVINPMLMLKLSVLAMVLLLITVVWLGSRSERKPSWIESNAKLYSSVTTSTLFLAGFLLIVHPYIVGDGPNILLSLISIVLLKRSAKAGYSLITGSLSLSSDRITVDPLMFRSGKIVTRELPTRTELRDLFQKPQRQALVREHLPDVYKDYDIDVQWEDQRIRGLNSFKIVATTPDGGQSEYLRLHVLSQRNKHLVDREDHLFKHVSRSAMHAPDLLANFETEGFLCTILDYGIGQCCSLPQWSGNALSVLQKQWAIEPPKQLLKDYKLSHRMMWRRLEVELIERLRIAVETKQETKALNQFIAGLDNIRVKLSQMPLYIANTEMRGSNAVFQTESKESNMLMFWGRWEVVPVGYYLPKSVSAGMIDEALKIVAKDRHRNKSTLKEIDIYHVNVLANIEQDIYRLNYRSALQNILKMMNSEASSG